MRKQGLNSHLHSQHPASFPRRVHLNPPCSPPSKPCLLPGVHVTATSSGWEADRRHSLLVESPRIWLEPLEPAPQGRIELFSSPEAFSFSSLLRLEACQRPPHRGTMLLSVPIPNSARVRRREGKGCSCFYQVRLTQLTTPSSSPNSPYTGDREPLDFPTRCVSLQTPTSRGILFTPQWFIPHDKETLFLSLFFPPFWYCLKRVM